MKKGPMEFRDLLGIKGHHRQSFSLPGMKCWIGWHEKHF